MWTLRNRCGPVSSSSVNRPTDPNAEGGPGTTRARLRLIAVSLLAVIAARHLVFAGLLYFGGAIDPVAGALAGLVVAGAALAYLLAIRAVLKQSRIGAILTTVLCLVAAGLGLLTAVGWLDWLVPIANLLAAGAVLGSLPGRRTQ